MLYWGGSVAWGFTCLPVQFSSYNSGAFQDGKCYTGDEVWHEGSNVYPYSSVVRVQEGKWYTGDEVWHEGTHVYPNSSVVTVQEGKCYTGDEVWHEGTHTYPLPWLATSVGVQAEFMIRAWSFRLSYVAFYWDCCRLNSWSGLQVSGFHIGHFIELVVRGFPCSAQFPPLLYESMALDNRYICFRQ